MKYDLIVIGAGIMGTFHAFHAARKEKKVLLLEKNSRPVGSTIQNFGQIVPGGLDSYWRKYGIRSLEVYRALQNTEDFTLVQNGSVYLASDDAELQIIKEMQEINQEQGYDSELLNEIETQSRFPDIRTDYIKGSLFYPQEFSCDSSQFIYRMLDFSVKNFELDYRPNSPVIDITETQSGVMVRTSTGKVFNGGHVIVCSGYETSMLFPEIYAESGMVLVKLQMMKTKPLPQINLKSNILTGLSIRRYEAFEACPSFKSMSEPSHYKALKTEGVHILFKQLPDKSIIVGDSHHYASVNNAESLGLGINETVNQLMKDEARRILSIQDNDYVQSWPGYYVQHPDGIFEYKVSKNIEIRTGIGGKGMTSSAGYADEKINELFQD